MIELMIVVAIIGLLAAIAIPAYQDYIVRARVSEGITLADRAKVSVGEQFVLKGAFPSSNTAAGLPSPQSIIGNNVSSVAVSGSGLITVTFSGAVISGQTLFLTPSILASSIIWHCTSPMPGRYVPSSCR